MTTTSEALVAHAANDLRLDTIERAPALSHETVVAIKFGGICGSDLHYWKQGFVGESVISEPLYPRARNCGHCHRGRLRWLRSISRNTRLRSSRDRLWPVCILRFR